MQVSSHCQYLSPSFLSHSSPNDHSKSAHHLRVSNQSFNWNYYAHKYLVNSSEFVDVDQEVLFELILAANYMDLKPLLDLCCAKVASMIKGKTPEAIRKTFNIVNDFTPEEEAAIIAENKWAEES